MRVLAGTESVCPVCLKALPAELVGEGDSVYIRRVCPDHGPFSGLVWQGEPALSGWEKTKVPAGGVRRETGAERGCPHDCGRCPAHEQHACTVLFEITSRCNLACPVCFADSGRDTRPFAPLASLQRELVWIREHAGEVVLQLSGGEPTLHPDLPDLTREARRLFPAVQLNTNGLALAERPELAHELAKAGLSWVFLQFDGTSDATFTALRGRPLLAVKLEAVRSCAEAGLSVVLVPTVAPGVNDGELGDLLRLALSLAPAVRGMHLQPMTASGRNSLAPALEAQGREPLTLPGVLRRLCEQSGGLILPEHATAPNCEHSRCSFHCRYRLTPSGSLTPLRSENSCCGDTGVCCPGSEHMEERDGALGARRAIDVILRAWQGGGSASAGRETQESGRSCCGVSDTVSSPDAPLELPGGPGTPQEPDAAATSRERAAASGAPPFVPYGPSAVPDTFDAFDAFIAEARKRTFSVTCMAFQDCMNLDLARLRRCCVHVFARPDRLVPFCAYNLTTLDGVPLYRS